MRHRRAIGLVLLAIGGLALAEFLTAGSGETQRRAPALPPQVLKRPKVTIASLRGKPALINFWASWCGPCEKEAPELERFAEGLHGQGTLVGVDWNDRIDNARSFISDHQWSYPVLRDATGGVGTAYGLTGLPTTYVLNSRGQIVETLRGPQTKRALRTAFSSAE